MIKTNKLNEIVFHKIRVRLNLIAVILVSLTMPSCLDCAECTNCTDPAKDTEELCYSDKKEFYSSRREWRDDVKAYETSNQCDCR